MSGTLREGRSTFYCSATQKRYLRVKLYPAVRTAEQVMGTHHNVTYYVKCLS